MVPSHACYTEPMSSPEPQPITQRELRNDSGEIMRRLDQGEAFRGETLAQERRAARTAYYGYDPTMVMSEA